MNFIESFKQGYSEKDTHHYAVAGIQVRCPHCSGIEFEPGDALLNTTGLTILGLDWANREANLLICMKCSHVSWFLEEPTQIA